MDLAQLLGSGIDPAMLATLGNTGGKSQFTDMLMKSLNPNPAGDFRKAVGQPDVGQLQQLIGSAPSPERVNTAPNLPGPQHLQAIGFGMAQNAQTPGSSVGSSFGAGGNNALKLGGENAERAIREADAANRNEIATWQGKADLAKKTLDTQMKGPELDMKMMDLTGNSLTTDANRASTDAWRQSQAANNQGRLGVAQQNANTNALKAGTAQDRAENQLELGLRRLGLDEQRLGIEMQKVEAQASQAADAAAARAREKGMELSTRERIAIQRDFTSWVNRAVANKGKPLDDAELASLAKQFASQQNFGAAPAGETPRRGGGAVNAGPQISEARKAQLLADANSAISQGAPADQVKAELMKYGIGVQ
jgi:hypothetical protein